MENGLKAEERSSAFCFLWYDSRELREARVGRDRYTVADKSLVKTALGRLEDALSILRRAQNTDKISPHITAMRKVKSGLEDLHIELTNEKPVEGRSSSNGHNHFGNALPGVRSHQKNQSAHAVAR
jgi:hypothetical protein